MEELPIIFEMNAVHHVTVSRNHAKAILSLMEKSHFFTLRRSPYLRQLVAAFIDAWPDIKGEYQPLPWREIEEEIGDRRRTLVNHVKGETTSN